MARRGGSRSAAVVEFLATLMPLYTHEDRAGLWCARSLRDGTLIFPLDESDWDEERGTVGVWWQGDPQREMLAEGYELTTLALERYVRLHGAGATEEAIGAELWFMARHFHHKTGCHVYLPHLPEPPDALTRFGRKATETGQGILTNFVTPKM